jgi:hypothetical protein
LDTAGVVVVELVDVVGLDELVVVIGVDVVGVVVDVGVEVLDEVVVLLGEVLVAGRLGYVGFEQQAVLSAYGPVWGASSKVMAISPFFL